MSSDAQAEAAPRAEAGAGAGAEAAAPLAALLALARGRAKLLGALSLALLALAAVALAAALQPALRVEALEGPDLEPCPAPGAAACGPGAAAAGAAVACWSADARVAWACWREAEAPWAAAGALAAGARCRAAAGGPFQGACALRAPASRPPAPPTLPGPLPWAAARERAAATLARMQPAEKLALLRGTGWTGTGLRKWWYVGNTAALPRLGVPSLKMQDAAGGFRTYWDELVGTVTCWPSLLALAATWDAGAVQAFAVALGEEFKGKGANGILGPSVDVHRTGRGGRNFEFLSGEDPYLGAQLAGAYVRGVQSQGVFAVMKHWVFNHQETNRELESSIVDDKTAWELYYPPFQAAVEAGVSAAMCSYNQVDGEYACSNQKELEVVLKGRMGFRGFVQSDWWATHATSLAQGLDQEMPSTQQAVYFDAKSLETQPGAAINEAATRILSVVHRMNLSSASSCSPPDCREQMLRNVTSAAHAQLARGLAAESITLLKNDGGVLPLSGTVRRIAVVGGAAAAEAYNPNGENQGADGWSRGDYYSGGGSGHVVAGRLVSPLQGIAGRAALAGVEVASSTSNDVAAGVAAAAGADVALVVLGATSGESKDRPSLSLDDGADDLVAAVAARARRTVVLVQAPGAVLMPWRDSVAAILVLFLGGQETGSAWADVLFGDHAPTGRLPISLPDSEADTIPPSSSLTVSYSEGMATGYRNRGFKHAFPFGHGLSYTSFEYFPLRAGRCSGAPAAPGTAGERRFCILAPLKNAGQRAGRTIAQLYLELPAEAGHPAPLLKGFQKTGAVLPGHAIEVEFPVYSRDLSFYDAHEGKWVEADKATLYVGESSADIRQSLQMAKSWLGAWAAGQASGSQDRPTPGPASAAPSPALRAESKPTPVPVQEGAQQKQCSSSSLKEDCRKTKCCADPGMQCYQKNAWWATCRAMCNPGGINKMEEEKYRTPWDCTPLGPRARAAGAEGGGESAEVVVRMRLSDVPRSWARGAPVTVVGDRGEALRGEVLRVERPAAAAPAPAGAAVAALAAAVALAAALAGLWAFWRLRVGPAAAGEGAPGFGPWLASLARGAAELGGALLRAGRQRWQAAAGGAPAAEAKPAAGPPSPQRSASLRDVCGGSPTRRPLIC